MLTAIARIAGVRLVMGLLIAGALGVGGFFFRDSMSGNVTEIRPGDCFDLPRNADYVQDVQHHPCTEPHTAEAMTVTRYAADGAWPGDDALTMYGETTCATAFTTYTGRDANNDPVLTFGYMLPTADGWANGDHDVTCYAFRSDLATMSGSVRITS
jgi:hypothetical protein